MLRKLQGTSNDGAMTTVLLVPSYCVIECEYTNTGACQVNHVSMLLERFGEAIACQWFISCGKPDNVSKTCDQVSECE